MSKTHRLKWRVQLRDGNTLALGPHLMIRHVVVVFAHTRTQFLAAHFGRANRPQDRLRLRGRVAEGDWTPTATWQQNEPPELEVVYRGEPPRLARLGWAVDDPAPQGLAVPIGVPPFDGPTQGCEPLWNALSQEVVVRVQRLPNAPVPGSIGDTPPEPFEDFMGPSEVFTARREAIAERAAAEQFFLSLDSATNPTLSVAWSSEINALGYKLAARLITRRLVGADDLVPEFDPIDPDLDIFGERDVLRLLSTLMRGLMQVHLRAGGPTSITGWAFELFATDRLAVDHREWVLHGDLLGHGAPNGTLFLQFVELALYALDNEVDGGFWERQLPELVRAAHVFLEHGVAQALGGSYPFLETDYRYREGRSYPRRRLEELRVEYADILASKATAAERRVFLEDRFTSLVSVALQTPAGSASTPTRTLAATHAGELFAGGISLAIV